MSQFPYPIPVPVKSNISTTCVEVSSQIKQNNCPHKYKSPCTTSISTEINQSKYFSVKRRYRTSSVKVQSSRTLCRLQKKEEELCQLTTLQKSWELTMAEIEKHYPDIFICQSEVQVERQKIMNQMVTEALHHINLRRMKDGHNPDKETDSEEERIYRNVMEQHKSLQKENEELTKKI